MTTVPDRRHSSDRRQRHWGLRDRVEVFLVIALLLMMGVLAAILTNLTEAVNSDKQEVLKSRVTACQNFHATNPKAKLSENCP